MRSIVFPIHNLLQQFIESITYIDTTSIMCEDLQTIDSYPIGSSFLAFILKEPKYLINSGNGKSLIRFNFTGQMDHYHNLRNSPMSMICIRFKPYGGYSLFKIPQHQLKNECIDVEDLMGNMGKDIKHQLEDNVDHPDKIVIILEKCMLKLYENYKKSNTAKVIFATEMIVKHQGNISIKELNKLSFMSKSSMEQHFNEKIGLTPKSFSRIIRFQKIFEEIKSQEKRDWIKVVDQYGYYDQSHFIHDFRHFFGYNPSQINRSQLNFSESLTALEYQP